MLNTLCLAFGMDSYFPAQGEYPNLPGSSDLNPRRVTEMNIRKGPSWNEPYLWTSHVHARLWVGGGGFSILFSAQAPKTAFDDSWDPFSWQPVVNKVYPVRDRPRLLSYILYAKFFRNNYLDFSARITINYIITIPVGLNCKSHFPVSGGQRHRSLS